MTYGYEEALARRAAAAGPVQLGGSSGYFAARAAGLDPSLFEHGDHLRPEVRRLILSKLYGFWSHHYTKAQDWSTAWIAGSGITTAWNADREGGGAPGDLDVLIGVDYPAFFRENPRFQGNSEAALVQHFNKQLHDGLWPDTARAVVNGSLFELTFYVNPGGTDIRDINPYAAYDVSNNQWTVRPVHVPKDFSDAYFTDVDRAQVASDHARASSIVTRFNAARDTIARLTPGSADFVNHSRVLHQVVREGAQLFTEIHSGRHAAFGPGGRGYFDPANYRWQAGKGNGAVSASRQLKQLDQAAHRDLGTPCDDTQHLLLVAALVNGGREGGSE